MAIQKAHIFVSLEYQRETYHLYKFLRDNINLINRNYRIQVHEITKSMLQDVGNLRDLKARGIMRLPALVIEGVTNQPILGIKSVKAILVPDAFINSANSIPGPSSPQRTVMPDGSVNYISHGGNIEAGGTSNLKDFGRSVVRQYNDNPEEIMENFYAYASRQDVSLDDDDDGDEKPLKSNYLGVNTDDLRDPVLSSYMAKYVKRPQGAKRSPTNKLHDTVQKYMPKSSHDNAAASGTPYHMRHEGPDRGGLAEREVPATSTANIPEDQIMKRPSSNKMNTMMDSTTVPANQKHVNKALSTINNLRKTMKIRGGTGMSGVGEDDADKINAAILKSARHAKEAH